LNNSFDVQKNKIFVVFFVSFVLFFSSHSLGSKNNFPRFRSGNRGFYFSYFAQEFKEQKYKIF